MDKSRKVVITGIGVIAPNGNNKNDFFDAICRGETGIKISDVVDMSQYRGNYAAQVTNKDFKPLNFPDDEERTVQLAYTALDEAMIDSKLSSKDISELGIRSSLSISTSLGGNLRLMKYVSEEKDTPKNKECADPRWLTDLHLYTRKLLLKAGIKGMSFTTNSACAAGTAAAGTAYELIVNNRADLVICGGCDPLAEFSIAGFNILKAMSPTGCRPFSNDRDGMILGEAAAFFVFEEKERAQKRGIHCYAEVVGYGLSNDAYHITSPDPSSGGAIRSMNDAIDRNNISKSAIDYINAHGTGTILNDRMEINGVDKVFGERGKKIMISSTKSMTGHCLGAAGSVELAVTAMAVDKQVAPPTANLITPEEGFEAFDFVREEKISCEIRYAISNSFAFAGNSASILLGRAN